MKREYKVESERYGHTHRFVSTAGYGNPYVFVPEQEWMPLYITRDGDSGTILAVDTEGGPMMYPGWTDGNITIERIEGNNFYLKENKND